MNDVVENLNSVDPMKGYKILNSVKPRFLQSKFPFSKLTSDKIVFTQNTVELLVNREEEKKGGDEYIATIVVYHL